MSSEITMGPERIVLVVPEAEVTEAPHKKYWRENKAKIMERRKLRPKAPLRPLDTDKIRKYEELQTQIRALQAESKKYVDEVRLQKRRLTEG